MLSRLRTERGDLLLLFMQLKHKNSSRVCSAHEIDTLTVDDEVLRKRMEKSIAVHDENREPMMVNEADSWFKKLRPTQIDMLFKRIYDRFSHLILSVQNQNKWFGMLGTSSYVNHSRRNPKRSAQHVLSYWNIGILHCTCGQFLHKERGTNQQLINYTMDLLSVPEHVIKKGRSHEHRFGKKLGDKKYHAPNQKKKRCKKKYFQGIHDRFIQDPEFRNRMIENNRDEELCRRWDALADEDHTHDLTGTLSIWE